MQRFTARLDVHSYAIDAFGALALPALAGYLQEVAGRHAVALGVGLDALRARGFTWMLARQRIEALAPVGLGDELEVATWPSGVERLFVHREFTVTRGGVEVARASTAWLVIDLGKRRPVRPDDVLDPALRPRLASLSPLASALAAPPASAPARRFEVRYGDIDLNRHVNAASYVAWAIECAAPERFWSSRPCEIEVHHVAEAVHGDAVVARSAEQGEAVLHALVRERDGKELARARTGWVGR